MFSFYIATTQSSVFYWCSLTLLSKVDPDGGVHGLNECAQKPPVIVVTKTNIQILVSLERENDFYLDPLPPDGALKAYGHVQC